MNSELNKINIKNVSKLLEQSDSFETIKSTFEESGVQVRTIKSQENTYLENLYLLVSNTDTDCDTLSPLQMQCNGLVIEKISNKIVCMAQNRFVELENDFQQIEDLIKQYPKFRMEYCEDGTVIRLYNYNGKWFTATTKCIDARKSYWSSEKTFDDLFWEIFSNSEFDITDLDMNFTYSFILIHQDNRIVVNHKYNNLVYINRINNVTQEEDFTNYFYNDNPRRSIRRTKQLHVPSFISDLNNYYHPDKRGIVFKFFDTYSNSWLLYRYDFTIYSRIKEIRGNVPLIRMRYLELLNDPEKLALLQMYYPENNMVFAMIKHCLGNLYKQVHNLYFQSHIKHSITIEEDNKFYRTLKQLHGQYKKQGTVITLEEVQKKINSLDPHILITLLGWFN